jgi:UDP-2-acetamido-2-deoxy-ribo-hexuluronate aminotransferase
VENNKPTVEKKIQMVDLVSQYERIQPEVDEAVMNVIRSSMFIGGPEVKSFQAELEEYLGAKHVIPCANGTDALQIAMMALGLEPGDEVITPTFTYIATAEVIGLLRLTPVLVDVDPETFCIDIQQMEQAITSNTKAIVPVHLYGQCANMEAIMAIANKHDIAVIEDTAQAIGSDYTFNDGAVAKAGTIGTFGTTSFFPSKNLGCYGDGGAIFTNDDELAGSARMIAAHGQSAQYIHDVIGCNSRLDAIQAAVLRIKLRHLDDYATRRLAVADKYDAAFAASDKIKTPGRNPSSTHVFHQYTLVLNGVDRDEMRSFLGEYGIPAMIYYPIPLHGQKAFENAHFDKDKFDVTDHLCANVISLPIHTEMDPEVQDHIIKHVLEFVNK